MDITASWKDLFTAIESPAVSSHVNISDKGYYFIYKCMNTYTYAHEYSLHAKHVNHNVCKQCLFKYLVCTHHTMYKLNKNSLGLLKKGTG